MNTVPNLNLVEVGGHCVAWAGYASKDGPLPIRVFSRFDEGREDVLSAGLSWRGAADTPSAFQVALETGRPVVLPDIAHEPDLGHWADTARRVGYRSMIALPLKANGAHFGCFSSFSAEVDAFTEPDAVLLEHLAQGQACDIQTAAAGAVRAQRLRQLRDEVEQDARKRLAAILHEVVGQSMQAVNLGLKRLRATRGKGTRVSAKLLDQLIAEVGAAIHDLRGLSKELRPAFLEQMSLLDAIRVHCSEVGPRSGVRIHVLGDVAGCDLDERVKEQCFLGFQEALGNAVRHAQANQIDVTLEIVPPGRLSLEVIDDGRGFDASQAFQPSAGHGLAMIRERAESVFGHAGIQSAPGRGTRVRITVPLVQEANPCPRAEAARDYTLFREDKLEPTS